MRLLTELAGDLSHGITAIRSDKTHKQAEENLRQTHDYLESLINYANAPILVWDSEFRITRFNHAAEHLTGYESKDIIGRDLNILFTAETRGDTLNKIHLTSSGEHWDVVEIPILRSDGNIRTVLWNSANIYTKDGKTLLATLAQGQDITERKLAEEVLKNENQKLQELDRKKSEFVSIVSHDLRTPLTSIMGFADTIVNRKLKLTAEQKEKYIGYIQDESRRLGRLISDYLDLSHIEDGKFELNAARTNISHLIEKVAEIFMANPKETRVAAKFSANLPEVKLDQDRIRQVLQNLIGTAIKYSPAKSSILVEAKKNSHDIIVSVADEGPGIPDSEKKKVFQRFYRGNFEVSKSEPGTGLGLTIAKGIVEKHGGKIWVESTSGKGSTFYFTLPLTVD